MHIFYQQAEARRWVREQTVQGLRVGLVPTMGALHEGHFSLVDASHENCDKTIATIFVNPTQFAPHEDLSRYPRTLESDLHGLQARGTDAVFVPSAEDMYPPGCSTFIDPPEVALGLEGACRPGHYRGVCTVVLKLFNLLPTTHAFFGHKDFQQAATIQAMVRDLNLDIQIVVCPTIRDSDGLALSSRNRYLSSEERQRALAIACALIAANQAYLAGEDSAAVLESLLREVLNQGPVDQIEYAVVADPVTLNRLTTIENRPAIALIAARVGNTRLIDNLRFTTRDG